MTDNDERVKCKKYTLIMNDCIGSSYENTCQCIGSIFLSFMNGENPKVNVAMNEHEEDQGMPGPELKGFVVDFARAEGFSREEADWVSIPGDGSPRRFWRIRLQPSEASYIVMENVPSSGYDQRENLAYLKIGRHLFKKGLPLPEIHRYSLEKGWFIMADLGGTSLQVWASRHSNRLPLYKRVIEILFRAQTEGVKGFDPGWTCQTKKYDREVMRRYESDYFREAFLRGYLGLDQDWKCLDDPFEYLADEAGPAGGRYFLYRDFQSRNILIDRDHIGLVDWQGGRLGPLGYDLASLLIDPYVRLRSEEKYSLFRHYLDLLKREQPAETETFERTYPYLAVQRNLQILGAFSFLSRVRGKTYFEAYIPPALKNLSELLNGLNDPGLSGLTDLAASLRASLSKYNLEFD